MKLHGIIEISTNRFLKSIKNLGASSRGMSKSLKLIITKQASRQ